LLVVRMLVASQRVTLSNFFVYEIILGKDTK